MAAGNSRNPTVSPMAHPSTDAARLYRMYSDSICPPEKPIAFSVPIWVRFSSTSRVMVVSATSRATRKKNTGKM